MKGSGKRRWGEDEGKSGGGGEHGGGGQGGDGQGGDGQGGDGRRVGERLHIRHDGVDEGEGRKDGTKQLAWKRRAIRVIVRDPADYDLGVIVITCKTRRYRGK